MFDYRRTDDRLTLRREGTQWLSSGFEGGLRTADAAHNLTVPEGWDRTDLDAYVDERLGDRPAGPTLLTGVGQRHARGARRGPVEVVVTAGISNPAGLPMDVDGGVPTADARSDSGVQRRGESETGWRPGTVNVFVGTTRSLEEGVLVELLATTVEAKAATLLHAADVPGTTSDAVVIGCDPRGDPSRFAGSATDLGAATRSCVREAVLASLEARYDDGPPAPADAPYGVETDEPADVFEP